ncbi:MAG: prepilin-type N-terminal cleavage/methylation domain-containing protein [Planctomycetaceae bacterium]|nr:prepilin-type N-terminal cleavage/methylation domain-containing protein [Planctomycetaceae bacterium]
MKSVVKKNAFTIVELLVAMALLSLMLALSGVIFSTTVKAYRTAGASIEISRNLRAVTGQLNSDFRGLRKDAPLFLWFDAVDPNDVHYDMVHFFANGDFQTVKQYLVRYDSNNSGALDANDAYRNEVIHGTVARVFYGHANSGDPLIAPGVPDYRTFRVLARKSHVLTSHSGLLFDLGEIPAVTGTPMYAPFAGSFGLTQYPNPTPKYTVENGWEFNTITLSDWISALNYTTPPPAPVPVNANRFVAACMSDTTRPYINLSDPETLHLLQAQGVLQMRVQWAYTVTDLSTFAGAYIPVQPTDAQYFPGVRWWPSRDPDGNGNPADSDFAAMETLRFGVHFQLPSGSGLSNWFPPQACNTKPPSASAVFFKNTFYPKALKFTFTLRDSNGLFKDGKTFTHIVDLDN